ncbi:MAG: hypothetical protein WC026_13255 [Hyphomicrobium sp.]|uniref:hypothetical protein n=1 Tax=Hyphomicrobium sp. TaxID=82 RepID=UPI003563F767
MKDNNFDEKVAKYVRCMDREMLHEIASNFYRRGFFEDKEGLFDSHFSDFMKDIESHFLKPIIVVCGIGGIGAASTLVRESINMKRSVTIISPIKDSVENKEPILPILTNHKIDFLQEPTFFPSKNRQERRKDERISKKK